MGELIINICLLLIRACKNTETFVIIFWRKLYGGSRILQHNITPQNGYLRFFITTNFSVLKKKTTRFFQHVQHENNEVQGTVKQFQYYVIKPPWLGKQFENLTVV